jgi:hypothetical protein
MKGKEIMQKTYYCKGDGIHHYKTDLPTTLRPFVDYNFESGIQAGDFYQSFQRKYKNYLDKILPEGYKIHSWNKNYYQFSAVIEHNGKYVYMSISDVRYCPNEWFENILVRTMAHDKDWTGGPNTYASIFNLSNRIQRLMER